MPATLLSIGLLSDAVHFPPLLRLRLPALAAEEWRRTDTEPSSAIVQSASTPPPRWALASSIQAGAHALTRADHPHLHGRRPARP